MPDLATEQASWSRCCGGWARHNQAEDVQQQIVQELACFQAEELSSPCLCDGWHRAGHPFAPPASALLRPLALQQPPPWVQPDPSVLFLETCQAISCCPEEPLSWPHLHFGGPELVQMCHAQVQDCLCFPTVRIVAYRLEPMAAGAWMHTCHERLQRSGHCRSARWVIKSCHAAVPCELLLQNAPLVLEPLLPSDLGLDRSHSSKYLTSRACDTFGLKGRYGHKARSQPGRRETSMAGHTSHNISWPGASVM